MLVFAKHSHIRTARAVIFSLAAFVVLAFSLFAFLPYKMPRQKLRFLPNPAVFKPLSPYYKSAVADLFFIQAVLSLAEGFRTYAQKVSWVQKNFALALRLDRRMEEAYFLGGVVIANDKPSLKKGIKFLKLYRPLNPQDWHIPYWIGFNYYLLGDYLKALRYYKEASLFKPAPAFLKSIQPMLYYRAGRIRLGIMFLQGLLQQAKSPREIIWIKKKLEWLQNIDYLEKKKEEFVRRFGRFPQSLEEMKEKGVILEVPADPFGKGYYLDKSHHIRSRF